ncbi:MAG: hypothetical protein IJX91_05665 [Clostridia bacterium]|nr:hypothetical protein [Clostridia bacterium]
MKLEKREITLNEFDSLKDAFYTEKTLMTEYVHAISKTVRKETRNELVDLIKEVAEDMLFVRDLMRGSAIENEE